MKKSTLVLASAVVLASAFGAGAYYYKAQQAEEIGNLAANAGSVFVRAASPSLGAESAKVQLVEFFDPACEACRMMYPFVKSLLRAHDGKLRLTLRYAPFHEGSDYVVKVLEATRLQGQEVYWKSLEAILASQPAWANHGRPNPQMVWDFLEGTGLDIPKAKQDLNNPGIAALMKQDAKDLATLKINKTPSFFINGKPLTEFGQNQLRAQVEKEIRATYP